MMQDIIYTWIFPYASGTNKDVSHIPNWPRRCQSIGGSLFVEEARSMPVICASANLSNCDCLDLICCNLARRWLTREIASTDWGVANPHGLEVWDSFMDP